MRIALGTLCVFNAAIFVVLGGAAFVFVDGRVGPLLAGILWLGTGLLLVLARHLRKGTEWGT